MSMNDYFKVALVAVVIVYAANRTDMIGKFLGPKALHA